MEDRRSYGENVAAISAIIHSDQKAYQEIYEVVAEQVEVGGFVGIWSVSVSLAEVFTIEEVPYTAGEDFYRVEAIEEFTHQIMGCLEQ